MSASAELQRRVIERLGQPGALRVTVPLIARRTKDLAAEIDASSASHGLCAWVMPPLPGQCENDCDFVMFTGCDVRVRIVEQPALNGTGVDAWALAMDVMTALHWQPFAGLLSHPLFLARRCQEAAEDDCYRILDVVFNAVYGLQPRAVVAPVVPLGSEVVQAPDLQAAIALQLRASNALSVPVPVIERRKKSLESEIEAAAATATLGIEVLPPRPRVALQGVDFVFIEESEIRVRLVEVPALNSAPVDAYDLVDEVCTALHWQTFGDLLPQPLRLAPMPVEEVEEGPKRILEVIFHATHQLNAEGVES